MSQPEVNLTNLTYIQLEKLVTGFGEPAYRARQLQSWLYKNLAGDFEEMTNLPPGFRQRLAETCRINSLSPLQEVTAKDGTGKVLFFLADGKTIESALMLYGTGKQARATVCLSTQVGCVIGCPFCATGQQGYERNLTAGEIIDQALFFARRLKEEGSAISNIVFMGMGEPLLNYDAVRQAVETLNSPQAFGLGARSIVISTAGIIPGIRRLAEEKLQVGLAVSLHAADDTLRDELVPINRQYPVKELIAACREYFAATGRRVTFEYILFAGINDSPAQARDLAHLVAGLNCHVNLIPANNTGSERFRRPADEAILAFEQELTRLHITCTVRQSKGQSINAGCGQLRSRHLAGRK